MHMTQDLAQKRGRTLLAGRSPSTLEGVSKRLSIATDKPGDPPVTFKRAALWWVKLGFINFGGPAGQIAVMHDEIVDKRRWLSHERFMHALNYCMLLPGPEAQQLAIYIGWLMHRTLGGVVAGVMFVLPGAVVMLLLSALYATQGDVEWAEGIFFGLQAAVIAIVTLAVVRVGKKSVKNSLMLGVAIASFFALFFVKVPFPLVVIGAGLIGLMGGLKRPDLFLTVKEEGDDVGLLDVGPPPTPLRTLRVLIVGLAVWWIPLLAVGYLDGFDGVFTDEAFFFSKTAMVTFGGAYAVLAYIDQAAVFQFGWLQPGQMLTGLGLAETTPGPLILVTEFVGFLAAYNNPGPFSPLLAGCIGAAVTLWATFVPCFLWIFVGAPYIERVRGNRALNGALSTITSAVVGVLANLSVSFALRTLFDDVSAGRFLGMTYPRPELGSVQIDALLIAIGAAVVMHKLGWSVLRVVALSGLIGLALRLAT